MRICESDMQLAQLLISGPQGTPYENGLFLFDVYFPPLYPQEPPHVNLRTTGGGTVRFNPNLYNDGKVCLSLLGTWNSGPMETWSHTSTLLQVAISIQALILVEQPWANEPGYERSLHTQAGQAQARAYNTELLPSTVKWAMIDMLKQPPTGFEAVVRTHFALKADAVRKQLTAWTVQSHDNEAVRKSFAVQQLVLQLLLDSNTDTFFNQSGDMSDDGTL